MGQPRKRLIAFGIAIFSGVAALSMLHGGWRDYSLAVELRDRGALAEGRYLGAEIFTSRERTSAGRINAYETVEREHGRWSYTVDGRVYGVLDRGPNFTGNMTVDRLGPVRPGQIVYLPESPDVAQMRNQIGVDYPMLFGFGGFLLLVALASGGIGAFVLKPRHET
ncbi:hypothetical protein [Allosphingosinicella sp.]|uniref:hypothetical protein n=1 Tax=Allosphingosinicella sp. TaxID=2823234 RepID=UPI002FC22A54